MKPSTIRATLIISLLTFGTYGIYEVWGGQHPSLAILCGAIAGLLGNILAGLLMEIQKGEEIQKGLIRSLIT